MNPLRLVARNYRTFDELDLELPQGCVAVLGENGAGKSSIVSAIDLAIFGPESRSLADALSDTASPDDDLLIELEFEHAGEFYRVRRTYSARGRGKATLDLEWFETAGSEGVDVIGWLPRTCESAKATQELIERTIGLSRETFRASAFLAQGDGAAFTEAQPRDRKRILADVLGLDRYDRLRDRARAELRELERRLNEISGRVANQREIVAAKPDVERQRGEAVVDELDAEDLLADREREHQALAQRWQEAREQAEKQRAHEAELAQARAQLEQLQRLYFAATEAALAKTVTRDELDALATPAQLVEIEQQVGRLQATEAEWRRLVDDRAAAVEVADRLSRDREDLLRRADAEDARFKAIRDQIRELETTPYGEAHCDRCKQLLEGSSRAVAIESLGNEANAHLVACEKLRAQAEEITVPELPLEIPVPTSGGVHLQDATLAAVRRAAQCRADAAQRARLEERLVALQVTIDARPAPEQLTEATQLCLAHGRMLDTLEQVDVAAIESEGLVAKRALDDAKNAFEQARVQRARVEERLAQIATAEEQIAQSQIESAGLTDELNLAAALERAFGPNGIPMLVVENVAIPYLETEASRILAELGTSFRVELRTQAALKSGEGVRDSLDVIIQTNESERPYETFSGGERTRLNLALRIALARLLAHRRGADSRLLCIDEPEFLDEPGTAALVDVLRGLQDDFDRVYLISHVPALRDSFDEVLTVVKGDDGRSHVTETAVLEPEVAA